MTRAPNAYDTEQQPSPSASAPQMVGVTAIVPGRREVDIEPLYLPLFTLSSSEPEKRLDPPRASYLPFLLLSLPPPLLLSFLLGPSWELEASSLVHR